MTYTGADTGGEPRVLTGVHLGEATVNAKGFGSPLCARGSGCRVQGAGCRVQGAGTYTGADTGGAARALTGVHLGEATGHAKPSAVFHF